MSRKRLEQIVFALSILIALRTPSWCQAPSSLPQDHSPLRDTRHPQHLTPAGHLSFEERFAELEAEVERLTLLNSDQEDESKAYCPGEARKIEAEFGEGFALVSEDEEFELRFHILN